MCPGMSEVVFAITPQLEKANVLSHSYTVKKMLLLDCIFFSQ